MNRLLNIPNVIENFKFMSNNQGLQNDKMSNNILLHNYYYYYYKIQHSVLILSEYI